MDKLNHKETNKVVGGNASKTGYVVCPKCQKEFPETYTVTFYTAAKYLTDSDGTKYDPNDLCDECKKLLSNK